MSIEIPVFETFAKHKYTARLETAGLEYLLAFTWHPRAASWYLDLSTADGEAIVLGKRVVAEWDLLVRTKNPLRPRGVLLVTDTSGEGVDPVFQEDLGNRVRIVFIPDEEFGEASTTASGITVEVP
jgi:hypothetical protein